jgi:hypothetical protein
MEVNGKFVLRNVNKKQERKSLRVVKEKEEKQRNNILLFLTTANPKY